MAAHTDVRGRLTDAPSIRLRATLPGVLVAGIAISFGTGTFELTFGVSLSGLAGALVLLCAWYVLPLAYLLATGSVLAFALLGPAITPATAIALGGLGLSTLGAAVRTHSPGFTGAGIAGALALLLAAVAVGTAVIGVVAGSVAVAAVFGVSAYGCHRYSVVRLRLNNPSQADSMTDAGSERGTSSVGTAATARDPDHHADDTTEGSDE